MKTPNIASIVLGATICMFSGASIALADSSSGGSNAGGGMPSSPDRIPQDKRTDLTGGQKGVPDEYATTPVRQGSLTEVTDSEWLNKDVTNKQGEKLGKITKVLRDLKTQKDEYVILEITGSSDTRPLPWARFTQQGDNLILNSKKEDLLPHRTDAKDMSPDLAMFMDQIEEKRAESKPRVGPGDGRGTNRPVPSTGTMGEDKAAGDLGPRGASPGEAPGFEGEGQKKH